MCKVTSHAKSLNYFNNTLRYLILIVYLCVIMLKKIILSAAVVILSAILTGCGSSRTAGVASRQPVPVAGPKVNANPKADALIAEARSWLGTPYRYGGEDRNGVDCSGLVLRVYKDALGIPLPRNSREQQQFCSRVSRERLVPGDLVFFAGDADRKKVSHVGIYIGDNNMIHSSSSSGVIVSDITSPYFKQRYAGAGMVEKYHAMLDKGNSPATPAPAVTVATAPVDSDPAADGYTMTRVDKLPSRKTATPTVTAVTDSPRTGSEPSVEQARASVLGSLQEKPLK